jgi:GGDEF domain-containing protein
MGTTQCLGDHCRDGGVALRWGGEKFLLVVDVAEGGNRTVGAVCDDAPPLAEHPELRVRWRL